MYLISYRYGPNVIYNLNYTYGAKKKTFSDLFKIPIGTISLV